MNLILILLLLIPVSAFAKDRVRHIECKNDQIVTVHAAMGIATIIQVPDHPNSVVVGDQDKFKVEYLDQAITIKPLRAGSKSNLYVYTDYQRFNVQLLTGADPIADYVVYLENVKPRNKQSKPFLRWTTFPKSMRNDEIIFEAPGPEFSCSYFLAQNSFL